MSVLVTFKTEVRDVNAIQAACKRLGLSQAVDGRHKVFGEHVAGWAVRLPAWNFPIVCQTETGAVHFDNYEGRWGNQTELDKFLQAYGVEKAILEARNSGYYTSEETLEDGTIKLTINAEA